MKNGIIREFENFTIISSLNLEENNLIKLINNLCSKYPRFGIVFFKNNEVIIINNNYIFTICEIENMYIENILMGVICIENEELSNYIL